MYFHIVGDISSRWNLRIAGCICWKLMHMKFCLTLPDFSSEFYQFVFPSAMYEHVYFLTALPTECIDIFLNLIQSHQWEMVWVVLICICQILSECEHFLYVSGCFKIFYGELSVHAFFPFFYWIFGPFPLLTVIYFQQNHSAIVLNTGCRRILMEAGRQLVISITQMN